MSQISLRHQEELADKHSAMARQCAEYGKIDDAETHMIIARALRGGIINALNSDKEVKFESRLA